MSGILPYGCKALVSYDFCLCRSSDKLKCYWKEQSETYKWSAGSGVWESLTFRTAVTVTSHNGILVMEGMLV